MDVNRHNDEDLVSALVEVCRRLYAKGFVAATDGNVSARTVRGTILTTRTAVNKGDVTAADLVEVTGEGTVVAGTARPSTELGMHLAIYRARPDANAVVHAHPPYATGFAAARRPLSACVFPEVILGLGDVPLASYATPSTPEVADAIAPHIRSHDAILLANHGVVTCGVDLWDAYYTMEKAEHAAHCTFVARVIGGEVSLTEKEVATLRAIAPQSYGKEPAAGGCRTSGEDVSREDVRAFIRTMIQAKV